MTWRDWYPEGSTVFVGGEQYMLRHNEHGLGLDLYSLKSGDRAMTIAPAFVPRIVNAIKYPEAAQ